MSHFLLILCLVVLSPLGHAIRDREGDLQLPVTDVSDIQKEEEAPTQVKPHKKVIKRQAVKPKKIFIR